MTERQVVELFHLIFLRALVAASDTKGSVVLKGGCNLRFYFGSVRYSEDMDLDVAISAPETLKRRVDRLLVAPAVTGPLKAKSIVIEGVSAPKQTETTQRWKLALVKGGGSPVRTKIEFSRRDAISGEKLEAVDAELARSYGMPPFLASHYDVASAIAQKVRALANRSEPQARDVFDLQLLFAQVDRSTKVLDEGASAVRNDAIERAMAISYDEYVAKVVAYLDASHADIYGSKAAWNAMQEDVIARLETIL